MRRVTGYLRYYESIWSMELAVNEFLNFQEPSPQWIKIASSKSTTHLIKEWKHDVRLTRQGRRVVSWKSRTKSCYHIKKPAPASSDQLWEWSGGVAESREDKPLYLTTVGASQSL